jgi:hypothetical protein
MIALCESQSCSVSSMDMVNDAQHKDKKMSEEQVQTCVV